ncbi:MAG: TIGR01777 family oxidoreductase [Methylococcaceae bacterium]|nr:TIGR01777 family oxidoreductase [Methylococcaceae bacterium]MDP3904858.1 TIGR01777 family oxidoreductase [Methylococcaceae bacterium]
MNILITGGTGFIGSKLTESLIKQGHNVTILSRDPNKVSALFGSMVTALSDLRQLTPDSSYQVIINLAGAPIFDARWSEARKQLLRNSRIDLTTQLVESMSRMLVKPDVFISGSAIGYYGDQGDNILTEQSASRADFSQQLCADWEAAAISAEKHGIRVCLIRTGLVIADGGGLLQRMLLPFRLCLGGRLGEGNQWMSWIHRQDWIAIAEAMIADNSMHGAYNATAPNPVTNNEFTKTLAACLKRPALLPVPAWLLKMLLGEMSELVLGSQRVIPDRLLANGFKFQYPNLTNAINQALHSVNE